MKIYEYPGGYEDYVAAQVEANARKLDVVWVTRQSIDAVCAHRGASVSAILCHGTRNGAEQQLFKERYPLAEVIGTEIAPTASRFPMTIQWDMQACRPGWIGKFDIVYSNAIDHAIYPAQTLRTWLEQLSAGGVLYIDHAENERCNRSDRTDPLQINAEEMTSLIGECGGTVVQQFAGRGPRAFETVVYAVTRAA